jgi:hypothetical protein
MYSLSKTTPLDDLYSQDLTALHSTIQFAEKSAFKGSHRMAASHWVKNQCILWGEPT